MRIAFADITDAVEFGLSEVKLKDSAQLPEQVRSAIASVGKSETQQGSRVSLKMHDKLQALDRLAQHLGLLSEFNVAIATLRTYGIQLKRIDNRWQVVDE